MEQLEINRRIELLMQCSQLTEEMLNEVIEYYKKKDMKVEWVCNYPLNTYYISSIYNNREEQYKSDLEKRIDSLEKFTTEQARLYNKLLERVGDDSIINKLDYLEDIYDDRTTELELEVLNLNEEIKKLKSYLKNTTWNGSM